MVRLLSRIGTFTWLHPAHAQSTCHLSTCNDADRSIAAFPNRRLGGGNFPNYLKSAANLAEQRPSAVAIRGLHHSELRRPCPLAVNTTRPNPMRRRSSIRSARSHTIGAST